MAKMTIYVNDDLKTRMDAVEESVTWSAIASRAFEIEIGEVAKRKQEKDMSTVIDRLRASKLVHEGQEYKDGHAHGKWWAEVCADYGELDRLYNFDEQTLGLNAEQAYDPVYLAAVICGDDGDTAPSDFWEGAVDDWTNNFHKNTEWYKGFVEGAQDVFCEVHDQL